MKYLLFFFSLFIFVQVQAQHKWQWGIQAQMGLSGQSVYEHQLYHTRIFDSGYTNEQKKQAQTALGFWIKRNFGHHIALKTGLQYAYTSEKWSYESFSQDSRTGQMMSANIQNRGFNVHRIQLPLIAELRIGKGNTRPIVGFGAIWNEDFVQNLQQSFFNPLTDEMPQQTNIWGHRANFRSNNLQLQFQVGLQINPQSSLIFSYAFAPNTQVWYGDFNNCVPSSDPNIIICYVEPEAIPTAYNKRMSIGFEYAFR